MQARSEGSRGDGARPAAERIVCRLCPRLCRLRQGERGACGIRLRHDGDVVVDEASGCLGGWRVEPIEAHALDHFLPGTLVLSVGRGGNNLRLSLQMNGDGRNGPSAGGLPDVLETEDVARLALELGCPSVALGGTDPALVPERATRLAEVCREAGLRTIALTRGYMCPAPRAGLFRRIDAARVELFAFRERFYWKYCNGHIAPVRDTLAYIAKHTAAWLEIAVPLIPGENDTVGEIERLARWVSDELGPEVPLHFKTSHLIAWHGAGELRRGEISAARARRIACMNGVRYAYTDDPVDRHGRTTACHLCGTPLIGREWYRVRAWNLTEDHRCPHCGVVCAGVFSGRPPARGEGPPRRLTPVAA